MNSGDPPTGNGNAKAHDLAKLEGMVKEGFREISISIKALETRVQCLDTSFQTANATRTLKLQTLEDDLSDAITRIKDIEKKLPSIETAIRIMTWVGVLLGGSIITLIWQIIIGSISLVR